MQTIISGRSVFEMETTYGLPLDVQVDLLREREATFNVCAYARAAYEAGWTPARIRERLGRLKVDADWIMALMYGTVVPTLTDKEQEALWETREPR